jgi:hypothetical protein
MSLIGDTSTLFLREMLIFKKNLRVNLIRSLIFPIIFILLLGSFGSTPKNVPIAVVNYDNGASALNFTNLLQSGGSVAIISQTTQQQAATLLSEGKIAAMIGAYTFTLTTRSHSPQKSQPQLSILPRRRRVRLQRPHRFLEEAAALCL